MADKPDTLIFKTPATNKCTVILKRAFDATYEELVPGDELELNVIEGSDLSVIVRPEE